MEAILSRLRDFSCRSAAFDERKDERATMHAERTGQDRSGRTGHGDDDYDEEEERSCQLDVERALAWLRRELMEMRSQDQVLIRQLIDLHAGIQELKLQCSAEEEEGEEEELDDEEEENEDAKVWDSGSESDSNSAYFSSGEVGFPCSCTSSRGSLYYRWCPQGRLFCRRSSVP